MAAPPRPPLSSALPPAGTEWRPGCVVRPATAADAEPIAVLWSRAYHDDPGTVGLPPAFLAERTIDGFRPRALAKIPDTLVACDWTGATGCGGGAVVGFCTAIARLDEVEQFFLAPSARGTGAAAALMAAVSCGRGREGVIYDDMGSGPALSSDWEPAEIVRGCPPHTHTPCSGRGYLVLGFHWGRDARVDTAA